MPMKRYKSEQIVTVVPHVLDFAYVLFTIDVGILLITLPGAVWSVALPNKRIWPQQAEAASRS